jgi:hypothetical protein
MRDQVAAGTPGWRATKEAGQEYSPPGRELPEAACVPAAWTPISPLIGIEQQVIIDAGSRPVGLPYDWTMARQMHRRRRPITQRTAQRIRPFFRYSEGRDAYVLRGIGSLFGPVFQIRWDLGQSEHAHEHTPD